jgi:D-alanyl-D-alanine-carboxypeptidase/D-alanyl-D-alanine-endopeptidase
MTHFLRRSTFAALLIAMATASQLPTAAQAKDKLLDEAVDFTGTVLFLETKVPGLVIGAVRNGEVSIAGYGKIRPNDDRAPDGKTVLRIGSNTKAFTGMALASLVADGTVRFTDLLQQRLGWDVQVPSKAGKQIRLIDLVTHSSGLPRETERPDAPADNPFSTVTKDVMTRNLQGDPLLFPPGTGIFYSNFGFDLLAQALGNAAGRPYETLLQERVLGLLGMTSTAFNPNAEQSSRLMQGHNFDGKPMPNVLSPPMIAGAGGLHSTAEDMLRWIGWHLDRFSAKDAELRLLDHAAYLVRDGLDPVYGMDESGRMDAMGLGWVVMMPKGERPLILQKAGGLQGIFSYTAFAPARGIGVFVAINQFDVSAAGKMAQVANDLIATLAPR